MSREPRFRVHTAAQGARLSKVLGDDHVFSCDVRRKVCCATALQLHTYLVQYDLPQVVLLKQSNIILA